MSDEKNKYITAYGSSNEDSYGRGDVTDISTKYNMLTTNPLSDENAPEINSCSSDGSYNQDIFGWKCFNSPASFRNGIYGECGAIIASDEFYIYQADSVINSNAIYGKSGFVIFNYGDARISCGRAHLKDSGSSLDSEAVHIKSSKGGHEAAIHVASTKTGDLPDAVYYSTIVVKSDFTSFQLDSDNYCTITYVNNTNNIQFTGNRDWIIGQIGRPLKSVYVETVNVASDIIPKTNANVSIGSITNKFKNIYGDIKLNNNLSFTTQYNITGDSLINLPTDNVSEIVNTNLSDYSIAIKLPKRTFITTPYDESNVAYVGYGDVNNNIDLPSVNTTYLAVSRIAPITSDPEYSCVGTSKRKYGDVWAINLHGAIPHADLTNADASTEEKYPIGCIIRARVSFNAFSDVETRYLPAGTENIVSSGTIYETIYDPYSENYIQEDSTNLNGMSWKTLISLRRGSGTIELNKTFDIYLIKVG